MTIGYNNIKTFQVCIGDPTADKNPMLFRAPRGGAIIEALEAVSSVTITHGDGTGLLFTVYNGGTSGTAQTVVGSALGGTTSTWTAQVPRAFSLSANVEMTEGEYLWVAYDETGTVAPFITLFGTYRIGSLS